MRCVTRAVELLTGNWGWSIISISFVDCNSMWNISPSYVIITKMLIELTPSKRIK
ncbi:hypothetical protein MCHI_002576 [Candidatus Magnetoovum chiemensis]|nr:hypothetical protein MCHI_002576 [Candidatus Magnetoovum chiemensis]